jgi:hypothetical protein
MLLQEDRLKMGYERMAKIVKDVKLLHFRQKWDICTDGWIALACRYIQ